VELICSGGGSETADWEKENDLSDMLSDMSCSWSEVMDSSHKSRYHEISSVSGESPAIHCSARDHLSEETSPFKKASRCLDNDDDESRDSTSGETERRGDEDDGARRGRLDAKENDKETESGLDEEDGAAGDVLAA